MNGIFSDVQGMVRSGYGQLTQAVYLLLSVRDRAAASRWLAFAPVANCETPQPDTSLQIAFTAPGLSALGLSGETMAQFALEFVGGMADQSRSRRLGDIGPNAPSNWIWGGPARPVHVAAMLFAKQNLNAWIEQIQTDDWRSGFEVVQTLETSNMNGREPFGFVDGISQPRIDWERKWRASTTQYANWSALGEFVLGYRNEYGKYTARPLLNATPDLPSAEDDSNKSDLGRNGTYLVLRQLEQDVRGFWQWIREKGGNDYGNLAAAMVGRSRDGNPLVPLSNSPIPGVKDANPSNTFVYGGDPNGTKCPFGAHIRRANPRNADLFGNPSGFFAKLVSNLGIPGPKLRDDLMASTRFHRVLRRGREYGQWLAPEDALQPAPPGEAPRGLQFACLNGNISRQFEFVQGAWLQSDKFDGLSDENDPLVGVRNGAQFTLPQAGSLPRRIAGMPQFVTVRGGAYFFLPGIRALRYIAGQGRAAS